jgi:hypothetical protein
VLRQAETNAAYDPCDQRGCLHLQRRGLNALAEQSVFSGSNRFPHNFGTLFDLKKLAAPE